MASPLPSLVPGASFVPEVWHGRLERKLLALHARHPGIRVRVGPIEAVANLSRRDFEVSVGFTIVDQGARQCISTPTVSGMTGDPNAWLDDVCRNLFTQLKPNLIWAIERRKSRCA